MLIDKFQSLRAEYIEDLYSQLLRAQTIIKDSLSRIETTKASGHYYSTNHDILNVAFRIHKSSKALGILKQLETHIASDATLTQDGTYVPPITADVYVDPFDTPHPEEVDGISPGSRGNKG